MDNISMIERAAYDRGFFDGFNAEIHSMREDIEKANAERAKAISERDKALEKQIPKKPIIDDPLNDNPEILYKCPCCGEVHNQIDIPYASFCPCCGQALDWSGE